MINLTKEITITKKPCGKHKVLVRELGEEKYREYIDFLVLRGEKQRQCSDCGRWYFPKEF